MTFDGLVYFVFLREDGCQFDVVLEHDFIVRFIRLLIPIHLLIVCKCLFQKEHALGLVVIAAHFSILSRKAEAQLTVVMIVQYLVNGVFIDL
jgi:hypothetical protein